jgi:ferric-dicitrate binding protein FerR (iron transport regulator)
MTQQEEKPIDNIIISYFEGTISSEELGQLRYWISENSNNRDYFKKLVQIHKASDIAFNTEEFDAKEAFKKISKQYPELKSSNTNNYIRQIRFSIGKVAAILVLGFLLGYGVNNIIGSSLLKGHHALSKSAITVPLGSKSKISLPDGTEVWLNAGSSLNYYSDYCITKRDVYLIGEGYFKVAKMKKPFIVHATGLAIKALGTEFNVKAYPDEKVTEAILVHGSIAVDKFIKKDIKSPVNETGVVLIPGQKVVYYRPTSLPSDSLLSGKMEVSNVNPLSAISWKEKCWIIEKEELQSLVIKLERKYDVKIIITNNDLKRFKFTGVLKNESIEQVLRALCLSAPIRFKFIKSTVYLSDSIQQ